MNLFDKIKGLFQTTEQRALKTISQKMQGKTLEENSKSTLRVLKSWAGKQVPIEQHRRSTIKAITADIKDCVKKGMTDKEIMQPAYDSPSFQALLKHVGLNLLHVKAILKEVRNG